MYYIYIYIYTNVSVITNYVLHGSSGLQFPISASFIKMCFYSAPLTVQDICFSLFPIAVFKYFRISSWCGMSCSV